MLLSLHQRRLLGAFLRAHRERLRPDDIGLDGTARRRTPGLRREEVAQRCGMSPTWYTWIEQGRDISVSAAALARLALALRLTAAERAYLFELAQARDPARLPSPSPAAEERPGTALQPALDAIAGPAYLMDAGWCTIAWNAAAAILFEDWFEREGRCLLDFMFLDPRAKQLVPDWEQRARRLAAEFRADTGRRPHDADHRKLIERLRKASTTFDALWTDHSVLSREGGLRLFHHRTLGALDYLQVTLAPAQWPEHRLVMLVDPPGQSDQ